MYPRCSNQLSYPAVLVPVTFSLIPFTLRVPTPCMTYVCMSTLWLHRWGSGLPNQKLPLALSHIPDYKSNRRNEAAGILPAASFVFYGVHKKEMSNKTTCGFPHRLIWFQLSWTRQHVGSMLPHSVSRVPFRINEMKPGLVFEGPVSRLEKDRNWTRPRPEKTRPAVWSFHFWDLKTAKKTSFHGVVSSVKTGIL